MKYICYRCFYTISKKSSFINHLNRKSSCKRNQESYKYNEKEINELNESQINNTEKKIEFICKVCNKNFYEKKNYEDHIKIHDYNIKNAIIGNNNEINIINNIQQNINININTPIPFDRDWDLSKINEISINKLLFSNFMYTKLLEEILKNEINLNVIIEDETNSGLVYKNDDDKYVNMKIHDIIEKSMNKLNKHLIDLNNNLDPIILEEYIKKSKTIIDKKMDDYNKNNSVKRNVDNFITDMYKNVNSNAIKICNKVNNNIDKTIENGY
jgi:hypothetical protein